MPGQSRTYGKKKESISRRTLINYVADFKKISTTDENVKENIKLMESALRADVIWDEIVELIYHNDPKEYVYDFTVPGNDSFMVDCNVLVHNTLNKMMLRTGDCSNRMLYSLLRKQCKYNYGLF